MDPDADLRPPALARIIADFMAALEISNVTLVGHDTGGALSQIVATKHPERIARLVLMDCDAYDNFPPKLLLPLVWSAYVPGGDYLLVQSMRVAPLRSLPIAFGWLTKRPIDSKIVMGSYLRPCLTSSDIRRDTRKVVKGVSNKYTLDAAKKFAEFTKPVLIAWAPEDRIFPWKYAERLAKAFPNARLERIEDSYTFAPEDQPQKVAQLIGAFMKESAPATAESC
jgi:pimeloyl-ACP methyl ester carboxylesterase